jgi:UV DNA damage endonuclease
MVDYSNEGTRLGVHSKRINLKLFKEFLNQTEGVDFDIMLEVKDKEKSALKAARWVK